MRPLKNAGLLLLGIVPIVVLVATLLIQASTASANARRIRPRLIQTINLQDVPQLKESESVHRDTASGYVVYEVSPIRVRFLTSKTIALLLNRNRKRGEGDEFDILLTAIFYDAESGALLRTMEWPARSNEADLLPVYDGGYLVIGGNKLTRYSANNRPIRERTLGGIRARDRKAIAKWGIKIAPGGHIALLYYSQEANRKSECTYQWIDVDTFEPTLSMRDNDACGGMPASDAVAMTLSRDDPAYLPRFFVRLNHVVLSERGQNWRPLAQENSTLDSFVNDDALLVSDYKKKTFSVINRRGEILFGGTQNGAQYGSSFRSYSSIDGNRFLILDTKPSLPFIQKYYQARFYLQVFDVRTKASISEMSLGVHSPLTTEVAISPDGSRIAVLTETTLRIYEIP